MAFNSIPQAWINSGLFAIQSLFQRIKDNFDALYSAVYGLSNSNIPNGSFEIDSDADGIPDNGTLNLYPGGSASLDTTDQAIAGQSLKFTSPGGSGNGGGYWDFDYVPCSELRRVNVHFAHKSSAAGIHNQAILRWYNSAKTYLSATTIYDSTANPTSWSEFIRTALPPAGARFYKLRVVGANSDNATAGSAWFDDVSEIELWDTMFLSGTLGELWTNSTSLVDTSGVISLNLPALSSESHVRITFRALNRAVTDGQQRWRVGTEYSSTVQSSGMTNVEATYTLDLIGTAGGSLTMYQQLAAPNGGGAAYGSKVKSPIHVQVLAW